MKGRPSVDEGGLGILEHHALVAVAVDLQEVLGILALVLDPEIAVAHVEAILVLVVGPAVRRILVMLISTLDEAAELQLLETVHARLYGFYGRLGSRQLALDRAQPLVERRAGWRGGFWRVCGCRTAPSGCWRRRR